MNYIYDALIVGFLLLDGSLAVRFLKKTQKASAGRGPFAVFCATLFAWLVIFYGSFIEPQFIVVRGQDIKLSATTTENVKIVLVSDFHLGPYKGDWFLKRAVAKISDQKPDMIILDGDFVYDSKTQAELLAPLKDLHAKYGVFAVLGNHDYGEEKGGPLEIESGRAEKITAVLRNAGVTVLRNSGAQLKIGSRKLTILGCEDYWVNFDIEKALSAVNLKNGVYPTLLISHNPDMVFVAQRKNVDLMLSGHTHAGQVRLPFIGPVPEIPDYLGRKYDRGLFEFGKTKLFITGGAGEINARARLFNPPEISVLNLSF